MIHSPSGDRRNASFPASCEAAEPASIRPDDVNLIVTVALAGKRYEFAARRPDWKRVVLGSRFQRGDLAAFDIHNAEPLALSGQRTADQTLTVWRPTGQRVVSIATRDHFQIGAVWANHCEVRGTGHAKVSA